MDTTIRAGMAIYDSVPFISKQIYEDRPKLIRKFKYAKNILKSFQQEGISKYSKIRSYDEWKIFFPDYNICKESYAGDGIQKWRRDLKNAEYNMQQAINHMKQEIERYSVGAVGYFIVKKSVDKIQNFYLNAKYNPRTEIGEKFVNKLYDENF